MKLNSDQLARVKQFTCGENRSFANGWSGPEAVAYGLSALKAGETESCRFFVANRENDDIHYTVTVHFEKGTPHSHDTFRQTDGGMESGLAASHEANVTVAAAVLSAQLYRIVGQGKDRLVFRDTREIQR